MGEESGEVEQGGEGARDAVGFWQWRLQGEYCCSVERV